MEENALYEGEYTESRLKGYIDNLFIQVCLAITLKDLERVKHFLSEEIYRRLEEQLVVLNKKEYTQMYDELNVASTTILNKRMEEDTLVVEVELISKALDYILDKEGKIVSGNNQTRKCVKNHLILTKKRNLKEKESVTKCSGCGANMDINHNGKCLYCGTIYQLEEENYILKEWIVE